MGFPAYFIKKVLEQSQECYLCHRAFNADLIPHVHSASGFHLIPKILKDGGIVFVASSPNSLGPHVKRGREKNIPVEYDLEQFGLPFRELGDAFPVCQRCHRLIHWYAMELCYDHIPNYKLNAPLPRFLVEATFTFWLPEIDKHYVISRVKFRNPPPR